MSIIFLSILCCNKLSLMVTKRRSRKPSNGTHCHHVHYSYNCTPTIASYTHAMYFRIEQILFQSSILSSFYKCYPRIFFFSIKMQIFHHLNCLVLGHRCMLNVAFHCTVKLSLCHSGWSHTCRKSNSLCICQCC